MTELSALAKHLMDLDPDSARRLLAEHVADPGGYCRGCALPQAGQTRWPCTLHAAATEAAAAQRVAADRAARGWRR